MLMTSCSRIAVHMVFIRLLGWADKPCQDEGISLQTWGACHVFSHTLVFNLGSRNRGEVPGPLGSWQQKKEGKNTCMFPSSCITQRYSVHTDMIKPEVKRLSWFSTQVLRGAQPIMVGADPLCVLPGQATAGLWELGVLQHGHQPRPARLLRLRAALPHPDVQGQLPSPPPSPVWLPLFRWRH